MEEMLTKEQVGQVLEFADALYNIDRYGTFSPWMSNQQLLNLSGGSKAPTLEKLKKALTEYKTSGIELQEYMNFMQKYDMLFARTLKSYSTMLAFDLQIVCSNATMGDYQSKEYLEDRARIDKFLNAFDYKGEFSKVVDQLVRNEVGYYTFRKTKWGNKGMKGTLQQIPNKWCMLTGYWEKGLLADLNMVEFLQPSVDIDGYDPAFKKYFNRVFGEGNGISNYIPSNPFNERTGKYAEWVQTTPDSLWVFKFNPHDFSLAPFLSPFLKSALLDSEVEALQYSKDMAGAYAILAGEIRLFDTAKSGTKADQFAISPKVLASFMQKVKAGLPDTIKAVAMPTENAKFYQFEDNNKEMYEEQLTNAAGVGSSMSRIIYSSDRMSNAELQYAAEAQYQIMKPLYTQFQNFMEYFANKMTKKFHFKFIFEGSNYEYEREKRIDRLMRFADKGIVLNESAYASALGMRPQDFSRSLEESIGGGWLGKLQLMLNSNTTAQDNSNGRPPVDDESISESGEMNRNQ